MELELVDKKLGKALDKTNKENVKKVIIVGEEEVAKNQITIKDMETGEETVESFVFNNTSISSNRLFSVEHKHRKRTHSQDIDKETINIPRRES